MKVEVPDELLKRACRSEDPEDCIQRLLEAAAKPKLYPNESVERIIAFIPPNHHHIRLIIQLADQTIILHEATIAAIVRAYAATALHPTRRAIELQHKEIPHPPRKHGYAKHQLVETNKPEHQIIQEATTILQQAQTVGPRRG